MPRVNWYADDPSPEPETTTDRRRRWEIGHFGMRDRDFTAIPDGVEIRLMPTLPEDIVDGVYVRLSPTEGSNYMSGEWATMDPMDALDIARYLHQSAIAVMTRQREEVNLTEDVT